MSVYRTFKGTERKIARLLGGKRTGHTGGADVTTDWLCVEVKHRASIPAWLRGAVAQARRNAGAMQLPIAVIHEHDTQHSQDLVIMTLGDFRDFFGDGDSAAEQLRRATKYELTGLDRS